MEQHAKLLIVDDEPDIRELLSTAFKFAGFAIETAANGEEALVKVRQTTPDLIILDIMMPRLSGLGVAKELRRKGDLTPILFLTAKDEVEDKIAGLNIGADDYVTKPFSLEEVGARVKAILKRTVGEPDTDDWLEVGNLTLDTQAHEVQVDGKPVDLSPTEYNLLKYLMVNQGRVVSKEQILNQVWGYEMIDEGGIVESYISYLRKKIDSPGQESIIKTKRGVGYLLRPSAD